MFASPFLKKDVSFKKEKDGFEKMKEKVATTFDEYFVRFIPSDEIKEMPPKYLYPAAVFLFMVLVATFFAVFIPSYNTEVNTRFLSPSDQSDERFCDEVTVSNTGTYLATKSGYWEGSTGFSYSEAAYSNTANNLAITDSSYLYYMDIIYAALQVIGERAKHQDLAANLLFWMSFVIVEGGKQSDRFTMTGSPQYILDRQHTAGGVSSEFGDCSAISIADFEASSGSLSVVYDYDTFLSTASCNTTVYPPYLGYTKLANPSQFQISIDVYTVITGLALNLGITSLSSMQQIVELDSTYAFNGSLYNVTYYVDPRYPGMTPVTCLVKNDVPSCALVVGSTYAIPLFNHAGQNTSFPEPCNCSSLTTEELSSSFFDCNLFQFLTGFLFWNSTLPDAIFELTLQYNMSEIIALSFYPMFVGSAWGLHSPSRDLFETPSFRQDLYSFCDLPSSGPCSFVTFSSFDLVQKNFDVSSYYYQVLNGACADTFSTTEEAWKQLADTPFAPLTQDYQTCSQNPNTVLFNQVGTTMGLVQLLTPLCILFVLLVVLLFQHCTGRWIPKAYSSREREDALDALGVALLLARDQRLEQVQKDAGGACDVEGATERKGGKEGALNDVVTQLARQLEKIAEESQRKQFRVEDSNVEVRLHRWLPSVLRASGRMKGDTRDLAEGDSHTALELKNLGKEVASQVVLLNKQSFSVDTQAVSSQMAEKISFTTASALVAAEGHSAEEGSAEWRERVQQQQVGTLRVLLRQLVSEFKQLYVRTRGIPEQQDSANPLHKTSGSQTSQAATLLDLSGRLGFLCKLPQLLGWEGEEQGRLDQLLLPLMEPLLTVLTLHVGVRMKCDLEETQTLYGTTVGYMVGSRVLTLSGLADLCSPTRGADAVRRTSEIDRDTSQDTS